MVNVAGFFFINFSSGGKSEGPACMFIVKEK